MRVCLRSLLAVALVASPLVLARPAPASAFGLSCDSPYYCATLTIALNGDGSGTYLTTNSADQPDGVINCQLLNGVVTGNSTCSHRYRGVDGQWMVVYFRVEVAQGSCRMYSPTDCTTLVLQYYEAFQADYVDAYTLRLTEVNVSVTETGEGTGRVISSPSGLDCPGTCSVGFLYGKTVTLTAKPDAGASFKAWTGACAGQGASCKLKPKSPLSTNAVFGLAAASPKPTATPKPGATPVPPPSAGPAPSILVPTSPSIAARPAPTASPSEPAGPPGMPSSGALPASPIASASPDLMPIALAILGAGLLIALAVLATGLRRRRGA